MSTDVTAPTEAAAVTSADLPAGAPADPFALFETWWTAARSSAVREPGAMALATAGRDGRCSSRTVALLSANTSGFVFTSHTGSRKAADIAETGWASGVLYWRETGQQITLAGPVARVSDEESTALWQARPRTTHAMSAVSQQGAVLDDAATLREAANRIDAADDIARPPGWSGYRLQPQVIEFWTADPGRLHHRLAYRLDRARWHAHRLQP